MIHSLKNAAKNSPDLANELRTDKGEHRKEKTVTLIESKKIGVNDIPSSVVDLSSVEHHPNVNADLDTSEIRLLRYKNFHESEQESDARRAERNVYGQNYIQLEDKMKPLYAEFKSQVDKIFPELSSKDFGISVNEEGSLIIINNNENLTEKDHLSLNNLLNSFSGSSVLTSMANEYAESVVKWVELDRKPDNTGIWVGKFDVTKENFHEIIDLVPRIKESDAYNVFDTALLQIWGKAEPTNNRHQVDEFVNGEWVNIQV